MVPKESCDQAISLRVVLQRSVKDASARARIRENEIGKRSAVTVTFWSVGVEKRRETPQNLGWLAKANL